MEVDVPEIVNLAEEEAITLGAPHPGVTVFQLNKALQYFNTDFILSEELKDNHGLYSENICFAIEKIFDVQMASDSTPRANTPYSSRHFNLTGETNRSLSKHNQLIQRFYHDLSLPESDLDSSVCVTLSTSVMNTSVTSQEEDKPKANIEEVSPAEDCVASANLVSLFWLMSILPEPTASKCKQVLDKDQFAWKLTLYDVILVLLNWGATLQSLHLEDTYLEANLFSPQLVSSFSPKTNKSIFPEPSNVVLVLNAISQRLPHTLSCSHRALLIKVLVYAALDHGHRRYQTQYCHAIRCVLNTYSPWGSDEANAIVKVLELDSMGLQNSVFVCCSLFNMTCSRISLVGLLASHKVLHQHFHLPAEASFPLLIQHLLYAPELLEKYKPWHIYIMACHIHSLLVKNVCQTPPCPQEVIAVLHQWTMEVRSALSQHPFMYTLVSTHVRERLARLAAECATLTRHVHNTYR